MSARLLLNDGACYFEGQLQITKGNFINAPRQKLQSWIAACGRSLSDAAGRANSANTIHFFRDDENMVNLHFSDFVPADQRVRSHAAAGSTASPASIHPVRANPGIVQPLSDLRSRRWESLPAGPGVYWWYFAEDSIDRFRISEFTDVSQVRIRRSNDGKICLYHGMAKDLRQRVAWHAEQELTQSALRSGFLSTLRLTLLALNDFDYLEGRAKIDHFMDRLFLSWNQAGSVSEAAEWESGELGGDFHYPLNIRDNRSIELMDYIRFLRSVRREYRQRYL